MYTYYIYELPNQHILFQEKREQICMNKDFFIILLRHPSGCRKAERRGHLTMK